MAINISTRAFYDLTTEHIGIKSGLLLNRFQIRKILLENYNETFLVIDDLSRNIRIYPDEFDEMLRNLRQKIGNLPLEPSTKQDYENLNKYVRRTRDIERVGRATGICLKYIYENSNITNIELAKLLEDNENYPKEISLSLANIALEREDQSCLTSTKSKSWNGDTKLSDLFECEIFSENENDFLDQKFIDYLAVNGNEIEKLHWRNFERFCAEYFNKKGRKVVLGPGTNDGGVDIRVFDPEDLTKPLILIQCKRYKSENKVSIETVKSFYTDVLYEDADRGLIATSSYISAGGKKVRNTRGYNIDFAEVNKVKSWATEMWRFKK